MVKELFPNLIAELARSGLSKPALAQIVGMSLTSLYLKLKGKTEFNLGEMRSIAETLETLTGQKLSLDYLFTKAEEAR